MIALRRATAADVDWLVELYTSDDVEPFLSGRTTRDRETIEAEVERSQQEPEAYGRMLIDVDGARAGAFGYSDAGGPHRIVQLEGLAVHSEFRGRRLADDASRLAQRYLLGELGFHRIELALLRVQRARDRAGGAFGFRPGGRQAQGVPAARRVAGRGALLAPRR